MGRYKASTGCRVVLLLMVLLCQPDAGHCQCIPLKNCQPPECRCKEQAPPTSELTRNIPQMVLFTFDDAVRKQDFRWYKRLFARDRKNPNGCPICMTLFLQDRYTDYKAVRDLHNYGMEIAVHSVSHRLPASFWQTISRRDFQREACKQKQNIHDKAGVPLDKIKGWRSPYLQPSGEIQYSVLQECNFTYDSTLTIQKSRLTTDTPWPFTLDFGWPLSCGVPPCPRSSYPGFWILPVVSLVTKSHTPAVYVDAYRPNSIQESYDFLWTNFRSYYTRKRAPFMLNMHSAWFRFPFNLEAMDRFIKKLITLPDVYIVTSQQAIDWIKNPVSLSNISQLPSWGCPELKPKPRVITTITAVPNATSPSSVPRVTTPTLPRTTTTSTTLPPTTKTTTLPRTTTTTTTLPPTTKTTTLPRTTTTTTTLPPTTKTTTLQRTTTTTTTLPPTTKTSTLPPATTTLPRTITTPTTLPSTTTTTLQPITTTTTTLPPTTTTTITLPPTTTIHTTLVSTLPSTPTTTTTLALTTTTSTTLLPTTITTSTLPSTTTTSTTLAPTTTLNTTLEPTTTTSTTVLPTKTTTTTFPPTTSAKTLPPTTTISTAQSVGTINPSPTTPAVQPVTTNEAVPMTTFTEHRDTAVTSSSPTALAPQTTTPTVFQRTTFPIVFVSSSERPSFGNRDTPSVPDSGQSSSPSTPPPPLISSPTLTTSVLLTKIIQHEEDKPAADSPFSRADGPGCPSPISLLNLTLAIVLTCALG